MSRRPHDNNQEDYNIPSPEILNQYTDDELLSFIDAINGSGQFADSASTSQMPSVQDDLDRFEYAMHGTGPYAISNVPGPLSSDDLYHFEYAMHGTVPHAISNFSEDAVPFPAPIVLQHSVTPPDLEPFPRNQSPDLLDENIEQESQGTQYEAPNTSLPDTSWTTGHSSTEPPQINQNMSHVIASTSSVLADNASSAQDIAKSSHNLKEEQHPQTSDTMEPLQQNWDPSKRAQAENSFEPKLTKRSLDPAPEESLSPPKRARLESPPPAQTTVTEQLASEEKNASEPASSIQKFPDVIPISPIKVRHSSNGRRSELDNNESEVINQLPTTNKPDNMTGGNGSSKP